MIFTTMMFFFCPTQKLFLYTSRRDFLPSPPTLSSRNFISNCNKLSEIFLIYFKKCVHIIRIFLDFFHIEASSLDTWNLEITITFVFDCGLDIGIPFIKSNICKCLQLSFNFCNGLRSSAQVPQFCPLVFENPSRLLEY